MATNFDSKLKKSSNTLKVYANKKILYAQKDSIKVNKEWINTHKLIVPKAVGVGSSFSDVVKPIYSEPNSICTETYIVIGPFNSKKCDSVISYIGTKFFIFCYH